MTFRYFDSTDASAPTLPGNTAGALITLLDAILVNGYGSRTALGWTKPYSGTNKAAYRPASGTRFYLRVVDDGSPATLTTRAAIVRGYENMTGIDSVLTDPFPLTSQVADSACLWLKSSVADATARPWQAWGDESVLYLCVQMNGATTGDLYVFGDVESLKGSDSFNCFINTRNSATGTGTLAFQNLQSTYALAQAGRIEQYLARSADGTVKSPRVALLRQGGSGLGVLTTSANCYAAPDENGKINFEPIVIVDSYSQNGTPGTKCDRRALFKGLFEPMHGPTYSSITVRTDTFQSTARYPGVDFRLMMHSVAALTTSNDRFVAQTSGDWVAERG